MDPRKRQGVLYYFLGVLLLLAAFGLIALFKGRWKGHKPHRRGGACSELASGAAFR